GALGGHAWPGEVLRLAMLMTHYREPIDFSSRRLEEAEAKLRDWQRAAGKADAPAAEPDAEVIAALADDLGFHRASVALDALARRANRGETDAAQSLAASLVFLGFTLDSVIGSNEGWEPPQHIAAAIAERLDALNAKDFAKADTIRNDLAAQGIALLDYKDEAGQRQTKWEVKR